jgi:PAS domain S-box-containing protein
MSESHPRTLLLVEDDAVVRLAGERTLRNFGFEVRTAGSGAEAVEVVADGAPVDLVLMDIDLGSGMDGVEAARRILEIVHLPIVFLTAHAEPEYLQRVKEVTRYGYVLKDTPELMLVETIDLALQLFAALREAALQSEEYKRLLDTSPVEIATYDENGTILLLNPAKAANFGGAPADFVGKTLWDVLPPEVADRGLASIRHVMTTGEAVSRESTVEMAGEWRTFDMQFQPVPDENGRIREVLHISHEVTERVRAVQQKQQLMAELNHRVSNNLAMVKSLISLKQNELGNAADLSDLLHQMSAIRLVHEKLQESADQSRIRFEPYVRQLIESILSSRPRLEVALDLDIGEVSLPSRTTTTLGLIVNELATNAMKHGFEPGGENRLTVRLDTSEDGGEHRLTVSNTGPAFPDSLDVSRASSLGLQLVWALSGQLGGTVELTRSPHPVFTIRFPAGT